MILLRRVIGDALRARRQSQHRTLREVSTAANVSLGYLSEIERGQKEASSELLAAICDALGAQLSELLREVSHTVAVAERVDDLVPAGRQIDAHPHELRPPTSASIVLPQHNGPKITVDGDVAVAVHQNSPLKATLRSTRNVRSPKRGREVALSH
jgi:transcriptional regulator with XRE-family HTH domain